MEKDLKVVTEFKHTIDLCLNGAYDREIIKKFNYFHTDLEYFVRDKEVPDSKYGQKISDLHWRLHASQAVDITVEVLEDGSMRVKQGTPPNRTEGGKEPLKSPVDPMVHPLGMWSHKSDTELAPPL